jgi:hypothetical protein
VNLSEHSTSNSPPPGSNVLLSTLFLSTFILYSPKGKQVSHPHKNRQIRSQMAYEETEDSALNGSKHSPN